MTAAKRVTLDDAVEVLRNMVRDCWPGDAPAVFSLLLRSGAEIRFPFPTTASGCGGWSLSLDGKLLDWYGSSYHITTNQVGPVRLLCAAHEDGTRLVAVATLVEAAETSADRPGVRDIFKRSDLLIDGILAVGGKRGTWQLLRPEEVPE